MSRMSLSSSFFHSQGIFTTKALSYRFSSLQGVGAALRKSGLESAQLIFGIDFNKSNNSNGQRSYNGRCLHTVREGHENPYQEVIRIIGETLELFDEDSTVPGFGFGDLKTKNDSVFPLKIKEISKGYKSVLDAYSEVAPRLKMGEPRSFAPLIHKAIEISKNSKSYHILVIISDGMEEDDETIKAIVEASNYPISIILIGVGDGPWHKLRNFHERLPKRLFDNFHFVNYQDAMKPYGKNVDAMFAVHVLKDIPDRYIEVMELKNKLAV